MDEADDDDESQRDSELQRARLRMVGSSHLQQS